MKNQYSDSPAGLSAAALTLAFDTGSPVTSVALGRGGSLLGSSETGGGRSSARLLSLIDELLAAHGARRREIGRVLAARGPGSFTGLRVGLATALGLHQALGVSATAVGSLRLLARAVAVSGDERPVVALVDALRGQWFAQAFGAGGSGEALADAVLVTPRQLTRWAPCRITGFGLAAVLDGLPATTDVEAVPAPPLASTLLLEADDPALKWDPARLVEPLYLRPPAVARGKGRGQPDGGL